MDEREGTIGEPAQVLEHRGMPRCAVDEAAMLQLLDSGMSAPCQLMEIGLEGCRLKLHRRIPADNRATAEISFKLRGIAFRLSGLIEWGAEGDVVEVGFGPMSSRRRDDLVEVLCEQEAENTGKASQPGIDARASGELGLAANLTAPASETQTPRRRLRLLNFVRAKGGTRNSPADKDVRERETSLGVQSSLAARPGPVLVPEIPKTEAVVPEGIDRPETDRPEIDQPESVAKVAEPAPTAATGRERRVSRRCDVDTSALIHLIKIGSRLPAQILDLSLGGCRLRTIERFTVGIYTRVEVEFRLQGLPVLLGGVIQSVHDRNHIGIRFLDVSARKRVQLTELIEEIQELESEKS